MLCHCETFLRSGLTHYVVVKLFCGAVSRSVLLRDFLRSGLTRYVVTRLFLRSVSRSVSLKGFSCVASHTLCRCKFFLRSGLTLCVVAKFFSRSSLTHYVVARLVCEAGSRVVLLRDFSAERFHALCRCETFRA